jgi:adenosine deaminase
MDLEHIFVQMKRFPKVDLHRHLEGSVSAETLLRLADTYGGDLPAYDLESLRPFIEIKDDPPGFKHFLNKFKVLRAFYTSRAAIGEAAYTAVRDAAEDNVKYLELRYSPSHFAARGQFDERDVVDIVHNAIQRGAEDFEIIVVPILTISRDYGYELARNTVDLALSLPAGYFCGLDIAGDEVNNSALPFAELFKSFKSGGRCLTVHAGEVCGAENVRQAVLQFNTDRIGHGIHAAESEDVMALLRKKNVLLEVCLTSNIHTGVVDSLKNHPFARLIRSGVPVCLNTDDPAISSITLTDDYVNAVNELGVTEYQLRKMNLDALDHAFYSNKEELKQKLSHHWQ